MERIIDVNEICRYCLSIGDEKDLISPCKCIGTQQYVHSTCLKTWLYKKINSPILPLNSNRFKLSCELCQTPYNLKIEQKPASTQSLIWLVCLYIFAVTLVLFTTYIVVGLTLQVSESSATLFVSRPTRFENVLANGFILTHLILGFLYIIALFTTLTNNSCFCIWIDCDSNNTDGEGCAVLAVLVILIGILCTVMLIYLDIVDKVVAKYRVQSTTIIEIKPFIKS